LRKVLSFVAAIVLVIVGIGLLAYEMFVAELVRGGILLISGMTMAAGVAWLADLIRPAGRKSADR
jgi:membrane-bound ClpP family serine protease